MRDEDIKLTGPMPPVINLVPITGIIQNQHQHLFEELVAARQGARYWRERAAWLERKLKHGCGQAECQECDR